MSDGDTQSMTDEQLIQRFGEAIGEKAGELSADCVAHAQMISALAGRQAGRAMLQTIIDNLTIERERLQ